MGGSFKGMPKLYLGDGVYADHNSFQVILTTENGENVKNRIYLNDCVLEALMDYIRRYQQERE